MTESERFKSAINTLKENSEIKFAKELAVVLGVNEERIKSLSKTNGAKLKSEEIILLNNAFPSVNWNWVVTGDHRLNEDAAQYGGKNEEKIMRQILSGNSTLSLERQNKLLIDLALDQQFRLSKISEINQESILNDIKKMFKKK
jgi:hypothetical protein